MAASRACGRSRAAAMEGSGGQAAATFPARRPPETMKADRGCGPATARGVAPKGFIGSLRRPAFAGRRAFYLGQVAA